MMKEAYAPPERSEDENKDPHRAQFLQHVLQGKAHKTCVGRRDPPRSAEAPWEQCWWCHGQADVVDTEHRIPGTDVQVFCIEPFDRLKPAHHSLNDHVPDMCS